MHHRPLHSALRAFAEEAATSLAAEVAAGAEVPFELDEMGRSQRLSARRSAPLYCYRPLTGAFIRERLGHLARLPTYAPAARLLEETDGLDAYLRTRGGEGGAPIPRDARDRADATLRVLLDRVFDGSTDFVLHLDRFDKAFEELEAVASSRHEPVATLVVGLPGLRLHSDDVPLADGVLLTHADAVSDVPKDAAWLGAPADEPNALAMLTLADALDADAAPARLRRLVRALRLYEAGAVGLAPAAWVRLDDGPWQMVDLGGGSPARAGDPLDLHPDQEDELRAFVALAARRMPRGGELAWALRRFDLACERPEPSEALTDLLLALRALLEPDGEQSAMLAPRLAALCAAEPDRGALAARIGQAIVLERSVIAGLAPPADGVAEIVGELTEHLRALLGDALCGHLDHDLVAAADACLGESAPA